MGRHLEAQERLLKHTSTNRSKRNRHIVSSNNLHRLFFLWCSSLRTDPIFARALLISLPSATLAALLEATENYNLDGGLFSKYGFLVNVEVYGVVTTLLGFLIVFRNSQAYGRFWEACSTVYQTQGLLFDAASSLIAFCSVRPDKQKEVAAFRHSLVRLLSLLNSLMIAELENATDGEDTEVRMPVLDPVGLKTDSVKALESQACKVEIVFQWIQQLAVTQLRQGVVDVPAPIATRAFQELGAGVLQFHEALKIAQVPFPNTYMASMMVLLGVHMFLTPICMVAMVEASGWAFLLTLISVFTLWALALLGMELDNPFRYATSKTIDLYALQTEQNERLVSLIVAAQSDVPTVVKGALGLDKLVTLARDERKRPPLPEPADSWARRGVSLGPILHEARTRAKKKAIKEGDDDDSPTTSEDSVAAFGAQDGVISLDIKLGSYIAGPETAATPPPPTPKMRQSAGGYEDFVHSKWRRSKASSRGASQVATASGSLFNPDGSTAGSAAESDASQSPPKPMSIADEQDQTRVQSLPSRLASKASRGGSPRASRNTDVANPTPRGSGRVHGSRRHSDQAHPFDSDASLSYTVNGPCKRSSLRSSEDAFPANPEERPPSGSDLEMHLQRGPKEWRMDV